MLVNAVFLQPSENQIQLLAQALNLKLDNLTFTGKQGTRTIFGCSQGLRHHLSAECSSSTFANQPEFLHHWIAVLEFNIDPRLDVEGFAEPAFNIAPTGKTGPPGTISYPRVV